MRRDRHYTVTTMDSEVRGTDPSETAYLVAEWAVHLLAPKKIRWGIA